MSKRQPSSKQRLTILAFIALVGAGTAGVAQFTENAENIWKRVSTLFTGKQSAGELASQMPWTKRHEQELSEGWSDEFYLRVEVEIQLANLATLPDVYWQTARLSLTGSQPNLQSEFLFIRSVEQPDQPIFPEEQAGQAGRVEDFRNARYYVLDFSSKERIAIQEGDYLDLRLGQTTPIRITLPDIVWQPIEAEFTPYEDKVDPNRKKRTIFAARVRQTVVVSDFNWPVITAARSLPIGGDGRVIEIRIDNRSNEILSLSTITFENPSRTCEASANSDEWHALALSVSPNETCFAAAGDGPQRPCTPSSKLQPANGVLRQENSERAYEATIALEEQCEGQFVLPRLDLPVRLTVLPNSETGLTIDVQWPVIERVSVADSDELMRTAPTARKAYDAAKAYFFNALDDGYIRVTFSNTKNFDLHQNINYEKLLQANP